MGQHQDLRHVQVTEFARSKFQKRHEQASSKIIITAIAVLVVGMFSLSVASGLADAQRIAAEAIQY